jgi:hypothetical protein
MNHPVANIMIQLPLRVKIYPAVLVGRPVAAVGHGPTYIGLSAAKLNQTD